MATSWIGLLTNDGAGNFTVTVNRNGSISGGTAAALPANEQSATTLLHDAIMRGYRILANLRADQTISSGQTVAFHIANSANNYTTTARYGAVSVTGGASVALPANEQTSTNYLPDALMRAGRRILNDAADGN